MADVADVAREGPGEQHLRFGEVPGRAVAASLDRVGKGVRAIFFRVKTVEIGRPDKLQHAVRFGAESGAPNPERPIAARLVEAAHFPVAAR
jgi:hypothetical protein